MNRENESQIEAGKEPERPEQRWRMPSGSALAEFALAAGFLAPRPPHLLAADDKPKQRER